MKKKILYILIVVVLLLIGICIIKIYQEKKEQEKIFVDEIKHRIVFIINKQQFNDHYQNEGFFIDNMGNKCHFDLSDESYYYADIKYLYKYLNEHIEEYEKEPFLEQDQLYKAYRHLLVINKNAETKEENVSIDYGYVYYYGIRQIEEKEEIIFLEESGDFEITVLDKNVDDILEIIGRDNWVRDIWEKSNHNTD